MATTPYDREGDLAWERMMADADIQEACHQIGRSTPPLADWLALGETLAEIRMLPEAVKVDA